MCEYSAVTPVEVREEFCTVTSPLSSLHGFQYETQVTWLAYFEPLSIPAAPSLDDLPEKMLRLFCHSKLSQ